MDLKGSTEALTSQMSDGWGEWEETALGGPDTRDSFLPTESIRPTESLLPTDWSDSTGLRSDEPALLAEADYGPNGNLSLLHTSDALAPSDFYLI